MTNDRTDTEFAKEQKAAAQLAAAVARQSHPLRSASYQDAPWGGVAHNNASDAGVKAVAEAVDAPPHPAPTWVVWIGGMAYSGKLGSFEQAMASAEQALKDNPRETVELYRLDSVYFNNPTLAKAL